jgi:hypothetical protein
MKSSGSSSTACVPSRQARLKRYKQTLAIGRELEAFLRDRRPRDMPAQPLEPLTLSAVERVEIDIQPVRGVTTLDEGDCAALRVRDETRAQLAFRSAAKRAAHRTDEHPEHVGTQLAVVP